jgi:ATP-dependent RNA helicase DDX18/HAS1
VNKLDLVKVGKSFGFSVPPRVNLNIAPGAGKSETSHNKRKRKQDASDESESEDVEVEEEDEKSSRAQGQVGKQRRIETLGKKMVDREVYRKGREQKRQKERGEQWSR